MKKYIETPRVNFTKKVDNSHEDKGLIHFERFSDSYLFTELQCCIDEENYETAILYRDELVKRGKLHLNIIY